MNHALSRPQPRAASSCTLTTASRAILHNVPTPRLRAGPCRSSAGDGEKVDIDELAKLLSSKAAELRASSPEPPLDAAEATYVEANPVLPAPEGLLEELETMFGEGGFTGDDFELAQYLGNLSVQTPQQEGGDTTLVVAYLARCSSGMPYSSPAPILLKEYLPQGRDVGINELRVLTRLSTLPPNKWLAATQPQPDLDRAPFITPVGYFLSAPSPKASQYLPADLPPEEESLWLVYRFLPLRPLSYYIEQGPPQVPEKAPLAFWQTQDALEGQTLMSRWRMLKALTKSTLESVAACHEGGVAHGALSTGCLLLTTVSDEDASQVDVKLDGFGFGRLIKSVSDGREDVKSLALVFAELYIGGLREAQEGGTDVPNRKSLENLLFGVFQEDMRQFRQWCSEDEQNRRVLEFLDAEGAQGWNFLADLTKGRMTARQLLEHAFVVDG